MPVPLLVMYLIHVQGTNGLHIHHSLWTVQDDTNAIPENDALMGLSDTARHWLAGLMKHIKSMIAITAPTHNSFKRLV